MSGGFSAEIDQGVHGTHAIAASEKKIGTFELRLGGDVDDPGLAGPRGEAERGRGITGLAAPHRVPERRQRGDGLDRRGRVDGIGGTVFEYYGATRDRADASPRRVALAQQHGENFQKLMLFEDEFALVGFKDSNITQNSLEELVQYCQRLPANHLHFLSTALESLVVNFSDLSVDLKFESNITRAFEIP